MDVDIGGIIMLYVVPAYRLDKLVKMVNKAKNKGGNISITVVREVEKEFSVYVQVESLRTAREVKVLAKCYEVNIEGEYKVNGWNFVATLEHTENGNIIRCINSEYNDKIPQRYYNCPATCEHCNKVRNRKDTYLIYNNETNEFKQVGKSCLLDYTQGLTQETCEMFANVFHYCDACEELDEEEISRNISTSPDFGFASEPIKKLIFAVVKKYGYEKRDEHCEGTAKKVALAMSNALDGFNTIDEINLVTEDEIELVDNYAKAIEDEYGYMRNAKLAWLKSMVSYRDFALMGSFIATYLRDMNRKAKESMAREKTQYVGNIGDKITIEVKSYRCLYTKCTQVSYYNCAYSYVYEIIDTKGNTYIWSSSKMLDDGITQISGTIKDHKEYKGTKQTIITRCKTN